MTALDYHGSRLPPDSKREVLWRFRDGLPVNERSIQAWLASPWGPIGKQMLVRARPQ